jgi:methylthioribose-1-phosphate isomerase
MPKLPPTVTWQGDAATGAPMIIDQTLLPASLSVIRLDSLDDMVDAIRRLAVRGAPAIGVAAAYGCVLALREGAGNAGLEKLARARPTAVNLRWAVDRVCHASQGDVTRALDEARRIQQEDEAACRAIGEHGASLIRDGEGVLTHCNAGALATAGIGTALAPLYVAHEQGRRFSVFADETRPLLQGSRLTAFELLENGLDVTVITDSMAASLMRQGRIHIVVTGADRITRNGDVVNKIGTYGLATLARAHGIPFYVAAPTSTLDLATPSGDAVLIEERSEDEILRIGGILIAPKHSKVYNPAFDVTPAELIAGLITEHGVLRPKDVASRLAGADQS